MSKPTKINYYQQAIAKCLNCGSQYTLGLTTETISLEICSNCHPFYTGQEILLDTAGRIEKFEARATKAVTVKKVKKIRSRKITQILESEPEASEVKEVEDGNESNLMNVVKK